MFTFVNDYDKQHWQAEQEARDAALEAQREKWAKARARSARNARRKLERLQRKLSESEDLTEWESEFAESVTERLDEFGSAFNDPQLGRPGDALSMAQKRVVASLNKKAKDLRKAAKSEGDEKPKLRSGFKSKSSFGRKKGYTPNIRRIEDEMIDIPDKAENVEPFIPEYVPESKRPFLRIVK